METILDSKTSTEISPPSIATRIKASSTPTVPILAEELLIKPQISAPFYFFSLKENDAPPFKKPKRETRPKLLIDTIMTEDEAVQMITAAYSDKVEGLRKYLGDFLVYKKIVANNQLSEKSYLISLLTEIIDYAAQRDFNEAKLACLLTIYLSTHLYFKWYYWLSPVTVWSYFKEIMIRHTIEDSPDGQEVFAPDECYDIVTQFHTVYLSNLPLVHILTFGAFRLKFLWPFKPK